MTSIILPPSIKTRLEIQRKFIHQKDNRNQEGVHNKHTWKHLLSVRKSPLVFVFSDSSHWSFPCFLPLPLTTSLSALDNTKISYIFLPLSRIYISLSKRDPPNLLEKIPLLSSFFKSTFLSYFLPFYNRFSHGNNICAILLKTKSHFFKKILLILHPNRWQPISSYPKAKKYDLESL